MHYLFLTRKQKITTEKRNAHLLHYLVSDRRSSTLTKTSTSTERITLTSIQPTTMTSTSTQTAPSSTTQPLTAAAKTTTEMSGTKAGNKIIYIHALYASQLWDGLFFLLIFKGHFQQLSVILWLPVSLREVTSKPDKPPICWQTLQHLQISGNQLLSLVVIGIEQVDIN